MGLPSTATGTINVLTELPSLNHSVTINGPGAGLLTINGSGCSSCSGFTLVAGGVLLMSNVTIRGFSVSGIHSSGDMVFLAAMVITENAAGVKSGATNNAGGGIYATTGSVFLTGSTVSANTASSWGGGISAEAGTSGVTIIDSTISGNSAGGLGGGLYTRSQTTITNSTISSNNSATGGGGIYNSAILSLTNATIADNLGGQLRAGSAANNTITALNTIIAQGGGGSGANCTTTTFNSLGNNISSDASCPLTGPNDRNSTNPLLIALANNGGRTRTHLVSAGSPAIDGGNNAGCPATDQRGSPRPSDGDNNGTSVCDVGAVEIQGTGLLPAAPTPTPITGVPTATPTQFVPPLIPQQVQNPGAMAAVMGGIGNGTRNNTPVPSRPAAVAPATGGAPVITPPSTGDAGLLDLTPSPSPD